jgi:hypothetical protein
MQDDRVVAIDALPVRRSHETSPGSGTVWFGHLAVALSVNGVNNFEAQYETIIDNLFRELGVDRSRRIYSAYELRKLLFGRSTQFDAFLFRFGRNLLSIENLRVTAFIGSFEIQGLEQVEGVIRTPEFTSLGDETYDRYQVPIYGRTPGREYVSLGKFLGLIQNPFPALAAWRLCERTGIYGQTFLLDNFEGKSSRAWDELIQQNRVYLVPDGDTCSPHISAADLLLRALDRQLVRNQSRVERDAVRTALLQIGRWSPTAELHVHTISNPEIPSIAPYSKENVVGDSFVRHPVLFVVNEADYPEERTVISNSPMMHRVYDRAYTLHGSVMFYRPDKSSGLIREGDWIVYYGPKGKETFRRLRKLGFLVKEWEAGEKAPDTGVPSP